MALTDYDQASPAGYGTSELPVSTPYLPGARTRPVMPPGARGPGGAVTFPFTGLAPFALNIPSTINLNTLFANKNNGGGQAQAAPLFANQRSAAVQGQVDRGLQQRDVNQTANEQSLTDFTKGLIASRGQVDQYGQEEQNAVGQIYGNGAGSLENQLAELRRHKQAATNAAAQSAVSRAIRANNFARATSGGSLYLQRALGSTLANINAQAAGTAADQGRSDLAYLTDQRNGAIGRRQAIIDNLLQRNLAPVGIRQSVEAGGLNALDQLQGINNANNLYEHPEDTVARRLNFYQWLQNQGAPQYY